MERLWTKSYINMLISMLFLFTAFYMLYPTLPLFIKEIGGNESQVGLMIGAFMLSAVIFRPIVGGLLDRFGRLPFIIGGVLLFSISMYLYNWVGGIVVLMALRILHGMSWAVSTTSILTAITDMIPSGRRGEGLGWSGMAMTLAMAIGPMFGIWVTENLSYHSLFLFAFSLSVIAFLLILGANIPFQPQSSLRKMEFFEKSVLPVTITVFFYLSHMEESPHSSHCLLVPLKLIPEHFFSFMLLLSFLLDQLPVSFQTDTENHLS